MHFRRIFQIQIIRRFTSHVDNISGSIWVGLRHSRVNVYDIEMLNLYQILNVKYLIHFKLQNIVADTWASLLKRSTQMIRRNNLNALMNWTSIYVKVPDTKKELNQLSAGIIDQCIINRVASIGKQNIESKCNWKRFCRRHFVDSK